MKKVISLILCVAMMGLCIFPVVAKEGSDIAVDLIIGGASNLLQSESEKLLASEAVARKGDVNYDGTNYYAVFSDTSDKSVFIPAVFKRL